MQLSKSTYQDGANTVQSRSQRLIAATLLPQKPRSKN